MTVVALKFVRKSFPVDAVRVSHKNIHELAGILGATVAKTLDDHQRLYICLDKIKTSNARQTKAYIGDWVVVAENGIKVYRDKSFRRVFEQAKSI